MVSTKIAKTTLQYRQNRLEIPKNSNTISKKIDQLPFSFKKYPFWIFYPSKISQILVQRPAISYVGGKNISLCFSYKILLVSSFSMRRCADKNNRWFFFSLLYGEKKNQSMTTYLPIFWATVQKVSYYREKKINPPLPTHQKIKNFDSHPQLGIKFKLFLKSCVKNDKFGTKNRKVTYLV